jgi:hypothetical protein
MIRVLLIYYSQSGDGERVARVVTETLKGSDVHLTVESLQPLTPYPFPWKSIRRFFNVFPECHWGPLPDLKPLTFEPHQRFDLVVLIYQVWFLAPSLPVQSFLRSDAARVLTDKKVLTITVSRNMWHSASETMKALLRKIGARHIDNVVLTHAGPVWATFVSTPRALLFGKTEGFWGIFPPAGIGPAELHRVKHFCNLILSRRERLLRPDNPPLLSGEGAVKVENRYVLVERLGWYCFRAWGRVILMLERGGEFFRMLGVYSFVVFLVGIILIGIPVTMIARLLLHPVLSRWTTSYVQRLKLPSEP